MPYIRDHEEMATALAEMARDLLAQSSVQATLDRIAAYAVELVDGCDAAGILVIKDGRVQTLTATDNVARVSDRMQAEAGEGPCFDAVERKVEVYRIADMTAEDDRWPRYTSTARRLGVGSMMGFLLFTNGENDLGALNMYSSRPNLFTGRSEQVGWLLASHAAVALASARTNQGLWEAIGTRQDIGEALGIVMERHKLAEQEAFDLLTKISQNNNVKIRDLAHTINTTGRIPEPRQTAPGRA